MEKIKINGKVIEFDEKNLKPLSDEELEAATGGYILPGGYITVRRYVCTLCGAKGPYFTQEEYANPEVRKINHVESCSGCSGYIMEEMRCFRP